MTAIEKFEKVFFIPFRGEVLKKEDIIDVKEQELRVYHHADNRTEILPYKRIVVRFGQLDIDISCNFTHEDIEELKKVYEIREIEPVVIDDDK